ncbi:MAG: BrnT family toxin [Steroidobacter sp.]
MDIRFTWDERKRLSNSSRHGLDFYEAPEVFAGLTFTVEDGRFRYGEQRFLTLGLLRGVAVSIAHTESDEVIRIISFRRATRHEEAILYEQIQNRLEENQNNGR